MPKNSSNLITKSSLSAALVIIAALLLLIPGTATAFEGHHDIHNYSFEIFGVDRGLPSDFVTSVTPVPGDSSSVTVGTWKGIVTFDGLIFHDFAKSTRVEGESPRNVTSLYYDAKGDLWAGTMFYENSGLFKFSNGQFTRYSTADGLPSNNVTCVTGGPEALYFGTWGGGLVLYEGDKFSVINKSKGLADNMISSVAYDPNSRVLWAGTKFSGASSIRDSKIEIMDDHTSQLVNNNVHMIAVDTAQNTVYFGTSGGYSKYNGATWQNTIKGRGSIESNFVRAIYFYRSTIYFATDNGLSISSEGNCFNMNFNDSVNFKKCQINSIYVDDRAIYLGTDRGLYKIGRRN